MYQYPLIEPETDEELQPEVKCCKTEESQDKKPMHAGVNVTRFSGWRKLVRKVAYLKNFIRKYKGVNTTKMLTQILSRKRSIS